MLFFTHTIYLETFMAMVFPDGSGLFQQDNTSCHTAKIVQECFEEHEKEFRVLPWPPNFPDLSPVEHPMGCVGTTNPIYGGPILQLAGLERTTANVWMSDTTGHVQRFCGVYGLMH